jgi:uncharacterized membrane-anchored protein
MKVIKKLLGIDKIEQDLQRAKAALEEAEAKKIEAEKSALLAKEQEELSKLSPKDRATRKKEPWVGVLNTHVNKDNVRNGFFELDWNEYFVLKLKQEGYGEDGDKDEEIVDRWFRELCANVVVDGDYGGPINTGMLDISAVKKDNQ